MDQGLDTVVDISDDGDLDDQATFDALWSILSAQEERVAQRFALEADSTYADLAGFAGESGWRGHFHAAAGTDMDWMVRSWSGDPGAGVTSMQLTAWLGPHVDVPHLSFRWGTLPELWFNQDYVARRDVAVDQEYLRRYYGPTNERFLELKADEGLSFLTNRALAARQHISHTAFCFICEDARVAGSPCCTHRPDRSAGGAAGDRLVRDARRGRGGSRAGPSCVGRSGPACPALDGGDGSRQPARSAVPG